MELGLVLLILNRAIGEEMDGKEKERVWAGRERYGAVVSLTFQNQNPRTQSGGRWGFN